MASFFSGKEAVHANGERPLIMIMESRENYGPSASGVKVGS